MGFLFGPKSRDERTQNLMSERSEQWSWNEDARRSLLRARRNG